MILVVSTCNFQLDVLQNAVSERRDNLVTRQTIESSWHRKQCTGCGQSDV